ncbi:MAG: ATP-binding protein [Pseudomonadales bacterium]
MVSLKHRLVTMVVGMVFVGWLITAVLTYIYATTTMVKQIDFQLEAFVSLTHNVMSSLYFGNSESRLELESRLIRDGDLLRFNDAELNVEGMPAMNLWLGDQQIALGAKSPKFPPPGDDLSIFKRIESDDSIWRIIYSYNKTNKAWIAAGVNIEKAEMTALKLLWDLILPVIFILPLTAFGIYFGTHRGLKPLRTLAAQISERSAKSLGPITTEITVHREIEPLFEELNRLLGRVNESLESEKRFTANAAHELQTPLAAIRSEVQLTLRQQPDATIADSLHRIVERVDRASHSVRQLLTLARLDPDQSPPPAPLQLAMLIQEASNEFSSALNDRKLALRLDINENVFIQGHNESLMILIRNLLSNACRYANESSSIVIKAIQSDNTVTLRITNESASLNEQDMDRLGERFYRPSDNRQPGAGLGLSIASRIAQRHHGELNTTYDEKLGRFTASLTLPSS